MKAIALIASLMATAMGLQWDHEFTVEQLAQENTHALFQAWRFAQQKVYQSIEEEVHRYEIFANNIKRIAESNDKYHAGELTYRLRMNRFGDLTDQEFHDYYNCVVRPSSVEEEDAAPISVKEISMHRHVKGDELNLQGSVDWTAQGVVTPVKDQGQCGSCWSFSATGAMECLYAIKEGTLTSLSEQQLVDCSTPYGNYGCNGGWYYNAWKYAEADGGLCTEAAYPYTAVDGTCQDSSCGTKYNKPSGYTAIQSDDETALTNAVNAGCVSVAIQANQFAFQYYSGGVLTGTCGTQIDHAVLVTGYGTLSGQDYWLVKNSWGTGWGEAGYVYICKDCNVNGVEGECGINMYPYVVNF
jgi:C1A family cysteine protease